MPAASGHARPPATGAAADDRPLALAEEHGLLLRQVALRAEDVLTALAADRWPTRELAALLAHLRAEVLDQVTAEERLLFPSLGSSADLQQLRQDHTTLHLMTEFLTDAAANRTRHTPAAIAAATRDLVTHLERHFGAEEAVLAAGARCPGRRR